MKYSTDDSMPLTRVSPTPPQVGSHLKTPLFPIWVVCSESHFSTLFGLQRELATNQDTRHHREFDLYYYDGLANQQQEIRLSVCECQRRSPLHPQPALSWC